MRWSNIHFACNGHKNDTRNTKHVSEILLAFCNNFRIEFTIKFNLSSQETRTCIEYLLDFVSVRWAISTDDGWHGLTLLRDQINEMFSSLFDVTVVECSPPFSKRSGSLECGLTFIQRSSVINGSTGRIGWTLDTNNDSFGNYAPAKCPVAIALQDGRNVSICFSFCLVSSYLILNPLIIRIGSFTNNWEQQKLIFYFQLICNKKSFRFILSY